MAPPVTWRQHTYLMTSATHSSSRNSSRRSRSTCMSIRFSIGAISGYILPMVRNDSESHRRSTAAKRLQRMERPARRARICSVSRYLDSDSSMKTSPYLANAHQNIGHVAVERVWQAMGLSDNHVDELRLVRQTLQEQITAGSVAVALNVELRQVGLRESQRSGYLTEVLKKPG